MFYNYVDGHEDDQRNFKKYEYDFTTESEREDKDKLEPQSEE